jgi:FKBP-type peptidyl-prolyl cis-trans isomerase FkpA
MPSSEKPTNTLSGDATQPARPKPKTTQRPVAKSGAQEEKTQEEKTTETTAQETTTAREGKASGKLSTSTDSSERKTSAKPSTGKAAPAVPRPEARVRKLTPQQQIHLARARRRRLNERLGLGALALIVIIVIAIVIQQVIAKNAADARLATAHAAATSTAAVHATATQTELNVLEPDTPPALTQKPVTTADGLQYIDIKVGSGAAVKEGDTISVRYVGWNDGSNCEVVGKCQFDSSYYENIQQNKDPMTTVQFQLVGPDQQGVIQGWVEGVSGMKPGGQRRLIIPASLGYKDQAQSGGEQPIPANATLIFDITLVSIDVSATPTPVTTTTPTPTPTPADTPTPSS